jgi:cytochrome c oxidase cbb3-type subunit 4
MSMGMDINTLRILVTIAALAAFLGIVWWAYAPSRKARFERDGLLPFEEEGNRRAGDRLPADCPGNEGAGR